MAWLANFFNWVKLCCFRLISKFIIGSLKTTHDETILIPSRDAKRHIKAHLYTSSGNSDAFSPRPVLLNFHGSGFVIPCHGQDDHFCRTVADYSNCIVLDVSYRMAPENPFPAALNDLEDAIKWVLGQPRRFDRSRVSLSGFSAGATLSAAAIGSLFPSGTFRSYISFYMLADFTIDEEKRIPPETGGWQLPAGVMRLFKWAYVPKGIDAADPRISPIKGDLERYPDNVLIVTGGYDSLANEAKNFADGLKACGDRNVMYRMVSGGLHSFDKSPKKGTSVERERDELYRLASQMVS